MSEEKVRQLNLELKAGGYSIRVKLVGDRLHLRGHLPPKPGSNKTEWHQQTIALGVYANPAGLRKAKAEATRVSDDLIFSRFDWNNYISTKPAQASRTVKDWVEEFEQQYFTERKRNSQTETTWQGDYWLAYRRLDLNAPLTTEMMLREIAATKPDTKTRQRFCSAYSALARFAGLELDVQKLRGRYKNRADFRSIPTDDQILEYREWFKDDPRWLSVYSLMAAYGLRNHEVFLLDLDSLKKSPLLIVLDGGKTGGGRALPCLPEWYEEWKLYDVVLPRVGGKNNQYKGGTISRYFQHKGVPFKPYDLRHAWAIRVAAMGLNDSIAATLQRHSQQVHCQVYHQHITDAHLIKAWEDMVTRQRILNAASGDEQAPC